MQSNAELSSWELLEINQENVFWVIEKQLCKRTRFYLLPFLHLSWEVLLFLWNPVELLWLYFHPWLTHFTPQSPFIAAWLSNASLTSYGEQSCKDFNKTQKETLYPLLVSAKNRQHISLLRLILYKLRHMLVDLSYFLLFIHCVSTDFSQYIFY